MVGLQGGHEVLGEFGSRVPISVLHVKRYERGGCRRLGGTREASNVRETRDDGELVYDLAALVRDFLLCSLEIGLRGSGFEGYLGHPNVSFASPSRSSEGDVR